MFDVSRTGKQNYLTYEISEIIEYFDDEVFISSYENPRSYLYRDTISQEAREIAFGLFGKRRGKIRTRCAFTLTNFSNITPSVRWRNTSPNMMPHPHIDGSGCLGSNTPHVTSHLSNGDWELAIQQTIQGAKNLNFDDTGIIARMMEWITTNIKSNGKYIIADNGEETHH